jgi:hypothetical protein
MAFFAVFEVEGRRGFWSRWGVEIATAIVCGVGESMSRRACATWSWKDSRWFCGTNLLIDMVFKFGL